MDIKKVIKVVFVDCISLLVGVVNGFLLPKFLSIESYAYIKTFVLYVGYSGIFHLGFSDGMYILLGGKNINEIKIEKIKGYMIILLKILFIVLVVLIIINLFIIKDIIFTCFILYTIPFQITLFASLLYRATGEFDKYIIIRSVINTFNLLATLSTIFIFRSPIAYIVMQILGYLVIALLHSVKILLSKVKAERILKDEVSLLISTGFVIMIANTVNNLFFSLDRWFVKLNFTINDFAYYSFGVSMLTLFTTLIGSITVIFYPYIAKGNGNEKNLVSIKKYIILICSFAPVGYFVLELIVINFIQQYIDSLEILGVLILSIPFMTVINVIYSNLYKATNRGNKYLKTAIIILMLAFILNLIVVYIGGNSVSIAYSTLISLIIWYLYSGRHFSGLKVNIKEVIYFFLYIMSYIVIKGLEINSFIKVLLFSFSIFMCIILFYKNEFLELIYYFLNKNNIDIKK